MVSRCLKVKDFEDADKVSEHLCDCRFFQVELLVDAMYDGESKVQKGAMQSYLHWLAAPSHLSNVALLGDKGATWTQFFPVATQQHNRHGLLLLSDLQQMDACTLKLSFNYEHVFTFFPES